MKTLILIFAAFMLTACGSGGGGGGASGSPGVPHVVDSTPHDYTFVFAVLTNQMVVHTGDLHQVCAFGYPGFRDETQSFALVNPALIGGIGCNAAENVILEATNTGTDILYLAVSIDGIYEPDVIVQPGTTYTFTRGY